MLCILLPRPILCCASSCPDPPYIVRSLTQIHFVSCVCLHVCSSKCVSAQTCLHVAVHVGAHRPTYVCACLCVCVCMFLGRYVLIKFGESELLLIIWWLAFSTHALSPFYPILNIGYARTGEVTKLSFNLNNASLHCNVQSPVWCFSIK